MSGRAGSTNLDSPRSPGVDGLGIPKAVASSRRQETAKAGAGEATSSLHTRRRTVDDWGILLSEENLVVPEARIFACLACLDSCLPKCVVDYIEQLCLTVYNCFARMTGGQEIQIQQARPDGDDAGSGAGASTEMETVTPETRDALEQLPDHIKRKDAREEQPAAEPARTASPQRRPLLDVAALMGDAQAGNASSSAQLSPKASPTDKPRSLLMSLDLDTFMAGRETERDRIRALIGQPGNTLIDSPVSQDSPLSRRRPAHEHSMFNGLGGGVRSPRHSPLQAPANASGDGEKPAKEPGLFDDDNFLEAWTKGIALTTASPATAGNASTAVATQPKPASPKADGKKAEAIQPVKKGLEPAQTFTVGVSDCNGKYLLTAHKRVFLLRRDVDASRWKGQQIRIEDGDNLAEGWRKCSDPHHGGFVGIKEVTDVRSPEVVGTATSLPRNSKWDEIDFYQ